MPKPPRGPARPLPTHHIWKVGRRTRGCAGWCAESMLDHHRISNFLVCLNMRPFRASRNRRPRDEAVTGEKKPPPGWRLQTTYLPHRCRLADRRRSSVGTHRGRGSKWRRRTEQQLPADASAHASASEAPPLEAGASSSDADADAATSGKKRERRPAACRSRARAATARPPVGIRRSARQVPDDAGPVAVTHNPEERAERRQKRVSKQAEKLAAANASLAAGGVDGLKGHEAKALLRAAGQRLGGDKRELKARWKAYSQAQGQSLPITAVAEAVVAEDVDDDDAEPTSSVEVAAHELRGGARRRGAAGSRAIARRRHRGPLHRLELVDECARHGGVRKMHGGSGVQGARETEIAEERGRRDRECYDVLREPTRIDSHAHLRVGLR